MIQIALSYDLRAGITLSVSGSKRVTVTSSQLSLSGLARRLTHQTGSRGWNDSWVWEIGATSCE